MSNTITLSDDAGDFATLYSDTVQLTIGSNGTPYYIGASARAVTLVLASLDATPLTIVTTGTTLTVNNIRATASAAGVTSHFSWTTNATGALDLVYTTPATTGQSMEWTVGDEIPPIKLKVKIVRR